MKKILILSIAVLSIEGLYAQPRLTDPGNKYDALTLKESPASKGGKMLSFSFDKKMSPLKTENNIGITVYQYNGKTSRVTEPSLKKTGSIYTSSVKADADATLIAFAVSSGENKDNYEGKGYLFPATGKDGKPVKGYYRSAAFLYLGGGEELFGIQPDPQKAVSLMEVGLKAYPELESDADFESAYFYMINKAAKQDAKKTLLGKLKAIEDRKELSESDYSLLTTWYTNLKMKPKADSFTVAMKQKYPNGNWIWEEMSSRFNREKNTTKKIAIFDSLMTGAPAVIMNDITKIQFKARVANAFMAEKNTAMFKKWLAGLPAAERASQYNNVSWNLAESGGDLKEAKAMSGEATQWAKNEMNKPNGKKPESLTKKQWEEDRKNDYFMYADTYAYVLYQMGDYGGGLPYAGEAATGNQLKNPELNERYAMLLVKAAPPSLAKSTIEGMVRNGKASPKTKDALKELYTHEKKSSDGFDAYVIGLEMEAKIKKQAEITKSMIDVVSPVFSLKDWDGKEVSLESMKGKIVIVDFWATWCGPCIASMPGMKAAQEKLAARDDVKFLFIDTWESGDNQIAKSKEFMTKKNYPFYVLMDSDDKMVGDFGVRGIPTKFIIDKNGYIRFKAMGFEGNTDELVDEVLTMVDLAGK